MATSLNGSTPSSAGRLQGKVAIVTGAASGFGLATTKLFVSHGCSVVAADMNSEALDKQFKPSPRSIESVVANVAKKEDWDRMVGAAIEKYGRLDIVVNNAGTSYRNKPTLEVTEEEFDRVFAVNVKSLYHSVNACVPKMAETGGGAFVNIASIGAMRPRPGLVWYNASKGAVANVSF